MDFKNVKDIDQLVKNASNTVKQSEEDTGTITLSGFFRDFLVHKLSKYNIPYSEIEELSKEFDSRVMENSSLETYNGTTYDKVFSPSEEDATSYSNYWEYNV